MSSAYLWIKQSVWRSCFTKIFTLHFYITLSGLSSVWTTGRRRTILLSPHAEMYTRTSFRADPRQRRFALWLQENSRSGIESGLLGDTEKRCTTFLQDNQYQRGRLPQQATLQTMQWKHWRIGFTLTSEAMRETINGWTYTCICMYMYMYAFTKCALAWPIKQKTSIAVARGLVEMIILQFGCPSVLVTEKSREFTKKNT